MALRARLNAPPLPPPRTWPWHKVKSASLPVSAVIAGDRRLEAETYLSTGFGIRTAIESKAKSWVKFETLAKVWMPGRLKGIQVRRDYGTPFLTATQVYDVRPIPRKWLALARTSDAANRFVTRGMILVTCSGSVGRPTLAYAPHDNTLISHDLLRIEAHDDKDKGWLYAYLHAPQVRAMCVGTHYGHIIKHLETSHLDVLPVPTVDDDTARSFRSRVERIVSLRDDGYRLTLEAEARFEKAVGPSKVRDWGEKGFVCKASKAFVSRRLRLDAAFHNPGAASIVRQLGRAGQGFTTIPDAGYDVWVPGRYKRIPAADGVIYRDSADLLEVSPDLKKRYADCRFGDQFRGRVRQGWILVASSGQVYGIIGSAILATTALDNQVVSNHVIRIAPNDRNTIPAGYILTALTHPTLGRPLIKALAFGSSIPEIDTSDLSVLPIVRLRRTEEIAIAELAEASAAVRAEADVLERQITFEAAAIIDRFIAHT
jgi:hypothetical protein